MDRDELFSMMELGRDPRRVVVTNRSVWPLSERPRTRYGDLIRRSAHPDGAADGSWPLVDCEPVTGCPCCSPT